MKGLPNVELLRRRIYFLVPRRILKCLCKTVRAPHVSNLINKLNFMHSSVQFLSRFYPSTLNSSPPNRREKGTVTTVAIIDNLFGGTIRQNCAKNNSCQLSPNLCDVEENLLKLSVTRWKNSGLI